MQLHALAERERLEVFLAVLFQRRHVWRRLRWRSAENVFQYPFAARDRRGACGQRSHGQNAALSKQAAPGIVGSERDAPELVAIDIRNAVVLREAIVDERVVRGQQIDDAAIFANDALKEQFRFAPER